MHIPFIMVLLTAVNGRKMIHELPRTSKHKSTENNVEFYQAMFQLPVDFKHLSRQGVGDIDIKQPFDGLRYRINKQRDLDHVIESFPKPSLKNIHELHTRNEMEKYKNINNTTEKRIISRLFDFSSILEKNLENPFIDRRDNIFDNQKERKLPKVAAAIPRKFTNISEYFHENRLFRKPNGFKMNWTTCDEFARNAVFHPDDIVNTNWLPFFIWSQKGFVTTVTHTFSYPTKKNVQYFRSTFGPYYNYIDWHQPKMLLNERTNILLIAGDRKGLFYGIPDHELPDSSSMKNITLPIITLRLKIHDPYLAMMYCDEHYAAIMAELGTEPKTEREALLEAATLNFKGIGKTVRRDIEEENILKNLKQNIKMENEDNRFIRIHKPIFDVAY